MFRYHVAALGQAMMDLQAPVSESLLAAYGMEKGGHQLIDQPRMIDLRNSLFNDLRNIDKPEVQVTRGGSAANTLGVIAALGGKTVFLSRFGADQLGDDYIKQLQREGVRCRGPKDHDLLHGCSLIAITPDGERTMNTFIGASGNLQPGDVLFGAVAEAKILHSEAYLLDYPAATEAYNQAAHRARKSGREVSFALSAQHCIERHREQILEAVSAKGSADIFFANEAEAKALYATDDFNEVVARTAQTGKLGVLTQGAAGATIVLGNQRVHVPAQRVPLVDTIGLGDAFAGGFLHYYANGHKLETCGKAGAICAANVAGQAGAKPLRLKSYIKARLPQA